MKKLLMGGVLLTLMSTAACESNKTTENNTAEDNTRVVDRDSVATQYKVTETVVEYDTTTRTKTVDAEAEKKKND